MNRDQIEVLKQRYPAGTRVRCVVMDDPRPVPMGTEGTVQFVDDIGTIHVNWDNGSSLGLVKGVDTWMKIYER